ncbi:substrate-binding periplasmic protein [Janthinobacterium agaricidamnosum]|uniref:substrate-binding periplasmic protein n=1 Tax=Janthinobacterium agaricidamnosum TaxID=55508 RepID=UPI0007736CCA|nr:transporter substrate-binding domain-containing protein [Janthinobacterium agaricidamnosum]
MLAATPSQAQAFNCPAVTRVGISDLGFSSYRDGASFRGASVDVVNELARRTGCKFELRWFPRGRMFTEFDNGHIDMVMGAAQTAERDRNGNFIPYCYAQFELVLSKNAAAPFRSLKDFVDRSHARLNIPRGISHLNAVQVQLDRLERAGRLEWVNDFDVVFKKIAAGRAEGTLAPPILYTWYVAPAGKGDAISALQVPESPRRLVGLYLSKQNISAEVHQAYTAAMRSTIADGSISRIYERYLDPAMMKRVYKSGVREILEAYKPG